MNERVFATRNTQLAAALAAFGVSPTAEGFSKILHTDGRSVVHWMFKEGTDDGKYATRDLADWWHSDDWFDRNYPDHPWALVMSALHAHTHLVAKIKEEPHRVAIKRKSSTWLVYEGSKLHKKLSKNYD
jgi:hypothetical protein